MLDLLEGFRFQLTQTYILQDEAGSGDAAHEYGPVGGGAALPGGAGRGRLVEGGGGGGATPCRPTSTLTSI